MYNFSLETLLYFARIRQLKGTFRSANFYGFGDFYDPCVVMITVQAGAMLSCTIYNRYSQITEITGAMMSVLHHAIVEWTFEDATPGYTHGHTSSFNAPATPSAPNWNQSAPATPSAPNWNQSAPNWNQSAPATPSAPNWNQSAPATPSAPNWNQSAPAHGSQTGNAQYQRTPPPNGMRNPQHSDQFQANTFSYTPAQKNSTGPFTSAAEPHHPVSQHNTGPQQDRFFNLVPLRLKAVSRSEVLQWKGNIKSIYMRTNGINTIAQIATMLSLPAADVLQILQQLEKEGLISLGRPV